MSTPVTLTGRIATEPALTFLASGDGVCKFTVVTDRRVKNDTTGQWESKDTTWWRCTAWKQLAEQCAEHLNKGDAVLLTGTASQDDYTDKDGNPRTSLAVRVTDIARSIRWEKPPGQQAATARPAPDFDEDRIPF